MNKEIVIVFYFRIKNFKVLGIYLLNKYLFVINIEDIMCVYVCKSIDKFIKFLKIIKF